MFHSLNDPFTSNVAFGEVVLIHTMYDLYKSSFVTHESCRALQLVVLDWAVLVCSSIFSAKVAYVQVFTAKYMNAQYCVPTESSLFPRISKWFQVAHFVFQSAYM